MICWLFRDFWIIWFVDDQRTEHLEYLTSWRSDGARHFPLICFSAADIVEGMVNKGIFLNGDNGGTFLHFGNYQNSCISDPTMCGPEGEHAVCSCYNLADFLVLTPDFFFFSGITFSFFWKNHEAESRFAVASGGKVISNGFSVYTNTYGGYVEFYTRGNNCRWKVKIVPVPGIVNGWTFPKLSWGMYFGLYINVFFCFQP